MTNGVTSFVKAPFSTGASANQKFVPSVLDLGSYYLTRNPRAEAAVSLFTPGSSGAVFAGLDSFVTVAAAQNLAQPQNASSKTHFPPPGPNTPAGQAYAAALDTLQQRETPAEAYLKYLLGLSPGSVSTDASASPVTLKRDTGAQITQGGTLAISNAQLYSSAPNTPAANIVYTVTDNPSNGRLVLAGDPARTVTSFTQADIAAGRLSYVHNGSDTNSDSFSFQVRAGNSASVSGTFNIGVSPLPSGPYIAVDTGTTVGEGAITTITTAQLNASDPRAPNANLLYTVTAPPTQGYLRLSTNPGVAITSFTQADLTAGHVQYVHNGTDNYSDSFTFRVSDTAGATSASAPATFSISVKPIDDPPVLTTNTGTTARLLTGPTIISTAQLSATDPDTAAANVTFTVTGAPANGFLDLTTAPTTPITSFTQADLQAGRVQYTHSGLSLAADKFTFTVKDQTTTLSPATFNINVTL